MAKNKNLNTKKVLKPVEKKRDYLLIEDHDSIHSVGDTFKDQYGKDVTALGEVRKMGKRYLKCNYIAA